MLSIRSVKKLSISSILFAGLLLTAFSFIFSACTEQDDTDYAELERQAKEAYLKQLETDTLIIKKHLTDNNISGFKSTKSGLFYVPLVVGQGGMQAKLGDDVSTHYVLRNLAGNVLEDSRQAGRTLDFTLGEGNLIPGYQLGVLLMKVGDKTRFYLPSGLAYGADGNRNIAPNTILIFDIELLAVK